LALVDGEPKVLSITQMLSLFLDYRRSVVRRRTAYRLRKAKERAHIVEGLLKAIDMIDEVIALIKGSKDTAEARAGLIEQFGFTEAQAQAILDMRLQRLTGLEKYRLEEELAGLLADISRYESILSSAAVLDEVVKEELLEVKTKFADKRRTEIMSAEEDVEFEDLIPEEEIVVILSRDGYIKRMPLQTYRCQGRGGKGVKGATPRSGDEAAIITVSSTHRDIFLFTSRGRVYAIKGHVLPEPKVGKGRLVSNYINLDANESIVAVADSKLKGAKYVFFITEKGTAKRMPAEELVNLTRAGRIVLSLVEGDKIARVRFTSGEDELLFVTAHGKALRVKEDEFRPMGRQAKGVRGIRLASGDIVVGCDVIKEGKQTFLVSAKGVGKRTEYSEFTCHHRGSGGVKAMSISDKTGLLVGSWSLAPEDEVMLMTSMGRVIRLDAKDISILSRVATGYRVVKLEEGDEVADVSVIHGNEDEGE
jgi:DNA gyrase subunit A